LLSFNQFSSVLPQVKLTLHTWQLLSFKIQPFLRWFFPLASTLNFTGN
jgi:hypothetical protein